MSLLSEHLGTIAMSGGAIGGAVASLRWFPGLWRGLIRLIAAPVLLGIERERRLAREEQVAELLDEIERLKHDADSRPG
ncbi:MAG: hypothetical protein IT477_10195 [Rhodanobacteraceae bacterium]|nr:hypothetical protein [Rhodanobacteraceae bacterium]